MYDAVIITDEKLILKHSYNEHSNNYVVLLLRVDHSKFYIAKKNVPPVPARVATDFREKFAKPRANSHYFSSNFAKVATLHICGVPFNKNC